MSVPSPDIYYTFNSNGNGTGTTAANITLARDAVIDTNIKLIGSGSLRLFPLETISTANNRNTSSSFSLSSAFVISFWFKTTQGASQTLFSMHKKIDNYTNYTTKVRYSSGSMFFQAGDFAQQQNGTNTYTISAPSADGKWHHVRWSANGASSSFAIDGVTIASGVAAGVTANNTPINKLVIGADWNDASARPFSGYIDDFRIWTATTFNGSWPTASTIYNEGYTIPNLIAGGTTFGELVTGGIAISTLMAAPYNYTMPQLFAGGVTIAQFIAAPYTVLQLIAGGITIDNLLTQYTYTQLIDNHSVTKTQFDSDGKTIQNLITGGVTISKLVTAQYSFSQMIAGGVTSTQFSTQSYSITDLVDGGATNTELLLAGYSLVQLQTAGILPEWSIDASANHLIKSYVKDFVDVSGSIVLRENSNLYISGNTETAGSLSLNRLVVEADASFNRRIFVGGDVSMNINVAMIGDLSMNGSVTKCNLNNSSIPKSAFSGAVPDGPDYNTSTIVYDQTFQANTDVSMNGPTLAANNVKVNGNIVFGDGTVMNTYDNNVSATNAPAFKASIFSSLDICGNLVAGSYATSSDYRIKTNVVELDETYTVDKLRPVKYLQTQINREKYGLIAHELQEHYPDLVIGEKDGSELQRVNYTGLIAILINDIKRLKRELTELETDVVVGR